MGAGYRIWDTGYRVQGTGYRVQGAGYRVQGTDYGIQGMDYGVKAQRTDYVVQGKLQDMGYRLWVKVRTMGTGYGVKDMGLRYGEQVSGIGYGVKVKACASPGPVFVLSLGPVLVPSPDPVLEPSRCHQERLDACLQVLHTLVRWGPLDRTPNDPGCSSEHIGVRTLPAACTLILCDGCFWRLWCNLGCNRGLNWSHVSRLVGVILVASLEHLSSCVPGSLLFCGEPVCKCGYLLMGFSICLREALFNEMSACHHNNCCSTSFCARRVEISSSLSMISNSSFAAKA